METMAEYNERLNWAEKLLRLCVLDWNYNCGGSITCIFTEDLYSLYTVREGKSKIGNMKGNPRVWSKEQKENKRICWKGKKTDAKTYWFEIKENSMTDKWKSVSIIWHVSTDENLWILPSENSILQFFSHLTILKGELLKNSNHFQG